jgi:hypothetical protein
MGLGLAMDSDTEEEEAYEGGMGSRRSGTRLGRPQNHRREEERGTQELQL